MDTRTMLIVAAISGLVLIVIFVLFFKSQAKRRLNSRVDATITIVQVEASSVSSWWTVTAAWSDPLTGQLFTFRSPHIRFPPKHQVGEHIAVNFDATRPKHYRMEL